jgi:cytidyltransferase-like protein
MKGLFKIQEDSAFGPGMMFGIPGPGPKSDTKGIDSDKEKEVGINPLEFPKYVKNHLKNIPVFEDFLFENAKGERVCIFPGRFQPFHLGHIAALERTSKSFNAKVIPIQILSKSDKSPIPDSLLQKIGKSVEREFSFIAEYVLYPQGLVTFIPEMVKLLQSKGYNPIGVGCGSDRLKDYERQVSRYLLKPDSEVQVEQFEVAMVDERIEGGPSGTKVRQAVQADNEDEFMKLTPKSIHKYYKELKRYM